MSSVKNLSEEAALLTSKVGGSTTTNSVNATRAALCETLATNVLRRWADDPIDEDGSDDEKLLELAGLLARNFNVFSGAPKSVTAKDIPAAIGSDWSKGATSALELAIVCEAKLFLRSQPCQDVIAAIWVRASFLLSFCWRTRWG